MSVLTADKAPFILVLLLTAAGWQASQLMDEAKSYRAAVSYRVSVDSTDRVLTAHVRNESRTATIVRPRFTLDCPSFEPCLVPLGPVEPGEYPHFAEVEAIPPVALSNVSHHGSSRRASVVITLPPGGQYQIKARLIDTNRRPVFFYIPDSETSQGVYLYDRNTFIGTVVDNYLLILLGSFILTLVAIAAFVVLSGVLRPTPNEDDTGGDTPAQGPKPKKRRNLPKT